MPIGRVLVLTAGTSDGAVAAEVAATLAASGVGCRRVDDVGVAGVHRVLAVAPDLAEADAVVVVAGMDGALPSVVAGLTDRLVVAVPTSVGYGAAFEGLAALLTMLTACAPGVLVVNIDNGFGAGRRRRPGSRGRPTSSRELSGSGRGPAAARSSSRTGIPAGPPRPPEPRDRLEQLGSTTRSATSAASTSTRAASPPRSRTRRFRTGSPASVIAVRRPASACLDPRQPLGR